MRSFNNRRQFLPSDFLSLSFPVITLEPNEKRKFQEGNMLFQSLGSVEEAMQRDLVKRFVCLWKSNAETVCHPSLFRLH